MTELGNRLKEAREEKGLSLDDLQELTKIQKRYLVGIEEGNYSMMPGKFYVRAFIKQYCEAIGLDSEEIFEQYKSDVPSIYSEELPQQLSRVQSRKSMPAGNSKIADLLPKILGTVVIIGIAILIWALISHFMGGSDSDDGKNAKQSGTVGYNESDEFTEKEKKADKEDKQESAEKEKSADKEEADDKGKQDDKEAEKTAQKLSVVGTSGKNSTYELKKTDSFTLKVTSKGSTWVGINNQDGKLMYQGTIEKGDSKEIDFSNEQKAVINIGRVPDTEIYVNDEKLEYALSPNDMMTQLITIQFTKDE